MIDGNLLQAFCKRSRNSGIDGKVDHVENNVSSYFCVCPSQYCLTSEDGVDLLERTDVHIHFPAGAVGKDGPSAGVTIVSVLVSLFRYMYISLLYSVEETSQGDSHIEMTGVIVGNFEPLKGIKIFTPKRFQF